ncbi:MAG: ATP-dependent metallopeptidase FtsH/Yme1/Tma family protein [Candidatus Acidiferrales bacterium]
MTSLRKAQIGWSYFNLTLFRTAFWLLVLMIVIVALRVMLPSQPPREVGYGALVHEINAGNIVSATFTKLKDGEEIRGELRTPPETFRTAISNDQTESLTESLRSRGVKTDTAREFPRGSLVYWGASAIAVLPVVAFLFLFRFQIKRLKRRLVELRNQEA